MKTASVTAFVIRDANEHRVTLSRIGICQIPNPDDENYGTEEVSIEKQPSIVAGECTDGYIV